MFDQVVSAVVNGLLAIPPVRFIMGLVDSKWRPFWAALWVVAIGYLIARTMNHLALRRARLRLLHDSGAPRPLAFRPNLTRPVDPSDADRPVPESLESAGVEESRGSLAAAHAGPTPPSSAPSTTPNGRSASVPLAVVAGAMVIGAVVVGGVAVAIRSAPNDSADAVVAPVADTVTTPATPIDVRWRGGRAVGDDCVGTFEVTRASGPRARFVAFVMDTSGAVMARDSAQVTAAVPGLFVEFRFRHVDCDEIDDWQMQVTTPKPRP